MFRSFRSCQSIKIHRNPVQCWNSWHGNVKISSHKVAVQLNVKFIGPFVQHQCNFHTSSRRLVPPVAWLAVKSFLKIGAALSGRFARSWFSKQPRVKQFGIIGILFSSSLGGVSVYRYYKTQETPITHRKRYLAHTPSQLQQLVDFEAQKILEANKEYILPANHPYYRRIGAILQGLLHHNLDIEELKSHKWTICVIKDKSPNAAVLANGYVFVNTGLVEFVHNDDQLAVVLGHEMAHAVLSHSAETFSNIQTYDYLVIFLLATIWMIIPNDGIALVTQWYFNKCADIMIHKPYSRQLETEADVVGIRFAAKACYDVREGTVFWKMMQMLKEFSGSVDIEWLSTHPLSKNRAESFDFLMPKMLALREECKCPPLPKTDPRDKMTEARQIADNYIAASKSRQNLKRMTKANVR